jgi:hypothetical protein
MTSKIAAAGASLILCALFLTACTEEEMPLDYSKALPIKVINHGGSTVQYSASSLFDSIGTHLIRIDNNTLISQIDKVFFADDLVIVVDQRVAKRILAYTNDGNLAFEFLNVNNVPYSELGDVIYIKEKGLLEVHDPVRDRIISYDAHTGALIKERVSKLVFFSFCYLGANAYAYYTHFGENSGGKIKHNLIIEDSLGHLKKYLPYYDSELRPADVPLNGRPFFSKSGRHYFAPYCSKYIYEITPTGVIPAISLDFGTPWVDVYGGLVKHEELQKMDSMPQFMGDVFIGKDNSLYLTYLRNRKVQGFLQLPQKQVAGIQSIKNDLTDVPLRTNFVAQTDSFIVQAVDLEAVNAAAEQYKYESKAFAARMKAIVNKYPAGSFLLQKLYFRL